jgi:asparagine synthase (glutamine-hydrolysing)
MCGLFGVFVPKGAAVPAVDVDGALAAIAHRGPDGEGRFETDDRRCMLGFRRLAIIDLATGDQPLHDPESGRVLVGNGEIYTYRELRAEMSEYPFRTDGDMETVLAAARRDGDGFVQALNGMYALALYEKDAHRLQLVRDRLGVKPLYHADLPSGGIVFASEIKALFASGLVRPAVDEAAVSAYLDHGWVPAPMTLFKGVSILEPGSRLTVAADGGRRIDRYWWATPRADMVQESDGAAVLLTELLSDSVRLQMRSDVPVGALLSGGIDSGLMVALAAHHAGGPLKTFTVSFEGAAVDEAPLAQAVADRYGTDHTRVTVPAADAGALLPMLAWRMENPLADAAVVPNWLVEQELGRHVTVALNGSGGDELFAGYGRYFPLPAERRYLAVPGLLRRAFEAVAGSVDPFLVWKLRRAALFENSPGAYVHAHTTQFPPPLRRLIGCPLPTTEPAHERFAAAAGPAQTRALLADLNTYLPDDLMMLLDRTTMGHGIEGRVPFLDHRFVEAALGVDPAVRTPGGRQKGLERRMAAGLLPEAVLSAPKQGFASPVPAWMRAGMGRDAERLLCAPRALERGWWSAYGVRRLTADPGRYAFRTYSLVMLELAVRMVVERPVGSDAPTVSLAEAAGVD